MLDPVSIRQGTPPMSANARRPQLMGFDETVCAHHHAKEMSKESGTLFAFASNLGGSSAAALLVSAAAKSRDE